MLLGHKFRLNRRESNIRALTSVKQVILNSVVTGSDRIEVSSTLHPEMAFVSSSLVSMSHPEHPDYDVWRGFTTWCLDYDLSVSLHQKPSALEARSIIVALPRVTDPARQVSDTMLVPVA